MPVGMPDEGHPEVRLADVLQARSLEYAEYLIVVLHAVYDSLLCSIRIALSASSDEMPQ